MEKLVKGFDELTSDEQRQAGGKGGMLSRMHQSGYPVPDGFVVLPTAFQEGQLSVPAWNDVQNCLRELRKINHQPRFAVRSSALSEDSAQASFAGEFDNVETDEAIQDALYRVYRSGQSGRVKAYSAAHGIESSHEVAIVIQMMVQAEMAGVLFTADPISGSLVHMIGNYIYGLGEQLVSGEADPQSFKLLRPRGKYRGPDDFHKYAITLYDLAARLEKDLGGPQDIEWAVAGGDLYILQSRPITTLRTIDYDRYEVNESLSGDFLWTSNNVGEALPDVMTPFTWSIIRELDLECQKSPGYYLWSGNICGRVYTNISMILSLLQKFGVSMKLGKRLIGDVFGNFPENLEVPIYPFSRFWLFREVFRLGKRNFQRRKEALKNIDHYLEYTQEWCEEEIKRIKQSASRQQLQNLWSEEIRPYVSKLWAVWLGGASDVTLVTFRKTLVKLVGEEEANLLLSNFRGQSGLESLGPLVGIMKTSRGEMSQEEYMAHYGHRSPHEFEMSIPYPLEDTDYLEKQIQAYKDTGVDVESLLNRQYEQYLLAKERFIKRYPGKQKWLETKLAKMIHSAQLRESVRSEFIKTFRVMRIFMLKVSEITEIGDKVFFLYSFEVPELLSGNAGMLKNLESRKVNYDRYNTLPPLPQFVRGPFDPFQWQKSNDQRLDYYDPNADALPSDGDPGIIKGFAGAAGKVEGNVRVLSTFEEGESLLPGEILVASTTNVGWTPLFPRAAAIITDTGAPLSHAAIVARELGIPAVVGCGTATTRLKTGDRVTVDGGQGVVQVLNQI
ncbi:MAG TPA: PEP/pyruvate-binding domain-containing protein [Syntrophomonadaceae bacterium]|nr:PEP/pyruvate-binding domain-containing protein [Syntrophomonadaceae bacterium]